MNKHEWIPSENDTRKHCKHCGIYEDYQNIFPECEQQEKYLAIICREVNPKTGKIAVYEIKAETIDDRLITMLNIRSRINMELRYFATPRIRWEGKWGKDYETILKRKEVTSEALRLIGGIVEI